MICVTINSDERSERSLRDCSPAMLEAARVVLRAEGGVIPGMTPYRVEIQAKRNDISFDIFRGGEPLCACVVETDRKESADSWDTILDVCHNLMETHPNVMQVDEPPQAPTEVPWLATLKYPWFETLASEDDALNINEFIVALAHIILEARDQS